MRNYNFYYNLTQLSISSWGILKLLNSWEYWASFGDRQKDKRKNQNSVEHVKWVYGKENLNYFVFL